MTIAPAEAARRPGPARSVGPHAPLGAARLNRAAHPSRPNPHSARGTGVPQTRGFLPWRLSDTGPGACRIAAMGRHPKPFTKAGLAPPVLPGRNYLKERTDSRQRSEGGKSARSGRSSETRSVWRMHNPIERPRRYECGVGGLWEWSKPPMWIVG
jgi:hypothetical protein